MSDTPLGPQDKAPLFNIQTLNGTLSLEDFLGSYVVLFFYPKDDTPGCTEEACAFQKNLNAFKKMNINIVGISQDNLASHKKFSEKYNLHFPLGSDTDQSILKAYGVWVEKHLYGRTYMGTERTTFLINPQGKIEKIWRRVKVKDHVDEILSYLEENL